MSDNEIPALPQAIVTEADDDGMDGQVLIVTANSATGLATEVIDVRAATPDAFPPRTVPARVVTDQASLLHETDRRPLLALRIGASPGLFANRKVPSPLATSVLLVYAVQWT